MNRIAVFADVQNIYYTTRDVYQRQFNYRALWQELTQRGDVVYATAYAIGRDDEGQKRFQSALTHVGFQVKLKPYIQRADGSAKGDWDVGITIDVLTISPSVDTVVLLSGDGDFELLLESVMSRHAVRTEVYAVERLTAKSLIATATEFHPIEEPLLMGGSR
ncbi:MAG: NYN domain-containing protein [Pseudomonadota bacterium]